MGKKKHIGICAICGEQKELTFEHYPPEAALNKEAVFIQDYRHLTPLANPHLVGKSIRSNRGMGGHKLCITCNNNTGGWYAKEYIRVAHLSIDEVIKQQELSIIKYQLKIKPLNFLKQILILHLCADKDLGCLREVLKSEQLILNKYLNSISDEVTIYMYANLSEKYRNMGISTLYSNMINGIVTYSEFNFPPFGFLLTLDSKPPIPEMMNITSFKTYSYDEDEVIDFSLPLLEVKSTMIGHYP